MNQQQNQTADIEPLEEEALGLLEKELEEEKQKTEDWRQKYLRALADYHNISKRAEEQVREAQQFAGVVFVEKLFPIIDVFQKAQAHCQDKGLDMAMQQMDVYLRDIGVAKLDVMGKPFDPYTMECVEVLPGKKEGVIEIVADGYQMYDKLIRPAKVKVGTSDMEVKSKNL